MDGEKNKMKVRAIKEKREKEKIGQVGQQEKKGSQNDVTLKKKEEKKRKNNGRRESKMVGREDGGRRCDVR